MGVNLSISAVSEKSFLYWVPQSVLANFTPSHASLLPKTDMTLKIPRSPSLLGLLWELLHSFNLSEFFIIFWGWKCLCLISSRWDFVLSVCSLSEVVLPYLWLLYLILMDIMVLYIAWSSSILSIISIIAVPFFCSYFIAAEKQRCGTVPEKPVAVRFPDEHLTSILCLQKNVIAIL